MRNWWRIRFWRFYCGSEKVNHLTLNRKLFLNTLYVSWEQTIYNNNQIKEAERCDPLFLIVYKYFKITAIFNFLAIVCFNVDGIFDRLSQFVSNLIAYIVVRLETLISCIDWFLSLNTRYFFLLNTDNILY